MTTTSSSQADLKFLGESTVDARGTTMAYSARFGEAINGQSFQGQALTTFKDYQYAIYWVTEAATAPQAHVAVARRKLPDGAWQVIDLADSIFKNGVLKGTNEPDDAHNTCSLGICPGDGTIHIAYDHHGQPLRYRVTAPGVATEPEQAKWDASLFQPERSDLVEGRPVERVTYPDFETTPDGSMQLFLRFAGSGRGSWWLWNYDAPTHKWTGGWQYDDGFAGQYQAYVPPSPTRCSYPNGWNYGPDGKLHVTWTWREGGQMPGGVNHDICYAYSTDRGKTWKNNAGQTVGDQDATGAGKFITLDSPGIVVVSTTAYESMINTQAQAVDSKGRIHVLMYRLDPKKVKPHAALEAWRTDECSYFHYWRADDGMWKTNTIPAVVGMRPKLVFDRDDNAYAVFTNGPTPGIRGRDRDLVIATASQSSGWADWKVAETIKGPFHCEPLVDFARMKDEGVLSIVIQNSPKVERESTKIRVLDFATRAKL